MLIFNIDYTSFTLIWFLADKRSSSPFTVLRSRSVPSQQSKESTNQSLESLSVDHCNSFPGEFVRETRADTTLSDTSADRTNLSNVSSGITYILMMFIRQK